MYMLVVVLHVLLDRNYLSAWVLDTAVLTQRETC